MAEYASTVSFTKPDPERMRVSECGRFLIVRHDTHLEPAYVLWHYQRSQGGFETAAQASSAAQRIWDGYATMGELRALDEPRAPVES